MRVIVPIKQMLDPGGITIRRDKERIFVNREEYIIEPGSMAALEAALRLKDAGAMEVVAISVGTLQADDALREALALGCDAAYLLCDGAFEDADVSVTVQVLAAAVEKLGGAELIVAGRESGDTGAGQIGPRLAEALGLTQATDVYAVEMAANELIGPPLGGLLVAAAIPLALAGGVLGYALAALGLTLVVGSFKPDPPARPSSMLSDIREGMVFLWRTPVLRTMAHSGSGSIL